MDLVWATQAGISLRAVGCRVGIQRSVQSLFFFAIGNNSLHYGIEHCFCCCCSTTTKIKTKSPLSMQHSLVRIIFHKRSSYLMPVGRLVSRVVSYCLPVLNCKSIMNYIHRTAHTHAHQTYCKDALFPSRY